MEVVLDRISGLSSSGKAAYLDNFVDVCVGQARLDISQESQAETAGKEKKEELGDARVG